MLPVFWWQRLEQMKSLSLDTVELRLRSVASDLRECNAQEVKEQLQSKSEENANLYKFSWQCMHFVKKEEFVLFKEEFVGWGKISGHKATRRMCWALRRVWRRRVWLEVEEGGERKEERKKRWKEGSIYTHGIPKRITPNHRIKIHYMTLFTKSPRFSIGLPRRSRASSLYQMPSVRTSKQIIRALIVVCGRH